MSMTSLSFKCTHCNFVASSLKDWGHFIYELNNQEVYVDRRFGWCDGCATITSVEVLPTQEEFEKLIELKKEYQLKLQTLERNEAKHQTKLRQLFRLKVIPTEEMRHLQYRLDELEYEISEQKQLIEVLANRKSAPKCLMCGSDSIKRLPSFNYPEEADLEGDSKAEYVMPHPNCSGDIYVSNPAIRFMMRTKKRFYDLDGRLLRIEDER